MADIIKGETCPICLEKKLSLTEDEMEIPFFGKTFVFSMHCEGCAFHKADIKVPQLHMSVTPGPASEGYISNIEGLLNRFEKVIEDERESSEEENAKTTAKNLLKKIRKVKWGEMPLKIVIEDPSGNSAIISEQTIIEKLKAEKKTKKK